MLSRSRRANLADSVIDSPRASCGREAGSLSREQSGDSYFALSRLEPLSIWEAGCRFLGSGGLLL
jgi:hypothetical protein